MRSSRPNSTETSSPSLMIVCPRILSNRGLRRLRHGRRIGPPQILTTCLQRVSWYQVKRLYSNPSTKEISEAEVRQRLMLEEEVEQAQLGLQDYDRSDQFTSTKFLLFGLDLERNQYVPCCPPIFVADIWQAELARTCRTRGSGRSFAEHH